MPISTYSKDHASLSVEEIMQPSRPQQTWLLTYIDVFVLIIMLLVTLIALSDFKTDQKNQSTLEKNLPSQQQIPAVDTKQEIVLESPAKLVVQPIVVNQTTENEAETTLESNEELTTQTPSLQTDKDNPQEKEKEKEQQEIALKKQKIEVNEIVIVEESSVVTEDKKIEYIDKNNSLQIELQKTVDELGLTDAINMKVSLGYAQLEIQDNVLFNSSDSSLLVAGKSLLEKLAPLLNKSEGLIYIEGHTDNRPINTPRFPSNWELGSARATSVLHFLTLQTLDASRLRAITYGETKPIADNTTAEGREKNRRVSLVIKVSDTID